MRKKKRMMALLLTASMMAAALSGCKKNAVVTIVDPTIVVQTQKAESSSMERIGNYVGTVAGTDAVYVIPMVSAVVTELPIKVGQQVAEGDVLCRLDDTTAQLKMASARTDYSLAENGIESAMAGYNTAVANYENAQISAEAQIGGNKTLNDYQLDMNIQSLEDQLESVNNTIDGYVGLVDNTNAAILSAHGSLLAAQEAYGQAKSAYEQAMGEGPAATGGNAANAQLLAEKRAAMESALDRLTEAQKSYTQAMSQQKTVNDGAISLDENRETLEKAIEQARVQQAIVNQDVYQDTVNIIESTKKVAASAVDSAQVGLETAQIHMQAAQVGIEAAEYELGLYTLTSPVEGIVEKINVTENNMAAAGDVSFVISNPDIKSAIFFVSEEVKSVLKIGQEVTATCAGTEYTGHITEIGISVDSATGLFRVKAALDNAGKLANGTKVELVTKSHQIDDAIMVPWEAVYFENGKSYLYTVENGVARKRLVEIAIYDTETIALSAGINAGEEVIVSWSSTLKDGAPVRKGQEGQ